jgi:hypothetical protein
MLPTKQPGIAAKEVPGAFGRSLRPDKSALHGLRGQKIEGFARRIQPPRQIPTGRTRKLETSPGPFWEVDRISPAKR